MRAHQLLQRFEACLHYCLYQILLLTLELSAIVRSVQILLMVFRCFLRGFEAFLCHSLCWILLICELSIIVQLGHQLLAQPTLVFHHLPCRLAIRNFIIIDFINRGERFVFI